MTAKEGHPTEGHTTKGKSQLEDTQGRILSPKQTLEEMAEATSVEYHLIPSKARGPKLPVTHRGEMAVVPPGDL